MATWFWLDRKTLLANKKLPKQNWRKVMPIGGAGKDRKTKGTKK